MADEFDFEIRYIVGADESEYIMNIYALNILDAIYRFYKEDKSMRIIQITEL